MAMIGHRDLPAATEPDADAPPKAGRPYTRGERISDAVVHLAALTVALAAVPVLITLTAIWHGTFTGVLGVTVYGICLIAMLTASLAYNHVMHPGWQDRLRRLDMCAIYLKIAGTVTPFALLLRARASKFSGR